MYTVNILRSITSCVLIPIQSLPRLIMSLLIDASTGAVTASCQNRFFHHMTVSTVILSTQSTKSEMRTSVYSIVSSRKDEISTTR